MSVLCVRKKLQMYFDEILWRGGCGPRNSWLDFGGGLDHDLHPGIFLKHSLFSIVIPVG